MKKNITVSFLLFFITFLSFSQEKVTLSGYVKDNASGEEIIGATVYIEETKSGAITNVYGFYSITLVPGTYTVDCSYLGYQTSKQKIDLQSNKSLNITIIEEATQLQEIVIEEEPEDKNIREVTMSRDKINMKQVKELPALFGEPDIIKNVQMQPGVISAGDGTGSFFVRGGSADQNLILLDEAPVYDPSHLFGMVSVFNADAIKSSELYKGGTPPRFGGRLSSLLDIRTKDGNNQEFHGNAAVGVLASKILLEGPIGNNQKSSFIVSARRSYMDLFMKMAGQKSSVTFHDVNAKLNWKPNNKNRLFLSLYSGRDMFKIDKNGSIGWGNQTASLRWNHLFSDRLFSNTTAIYSDFDYSLEIIDEVEGLEWTAGLKTVALKQDLTYFLNPQNEINFGAHATYRKFSPGKIASTGSLFRTLEMDNLYALDYVLYAGNEQQLSKKLTLQYGIRYTIFQNVGNAEVKIYEDPKDRIGRDVMEVKKYDRFEPIKTFSNFEPRFAIRYAINNSSSIKASYQRMVQYVHLISNSTVPIPFNTWAPSDTYLDPQKSDQYVLGYFRNFNDNTYEFSIETYYKEMRDVTDFADNAKIFFNTDLPTEYRQGNSDAYGVELKVSKNKGDLTGFFSYTLSKVERTVPDVNDNKAFLANYDRRNVLDVLAVYKLKDRIRLGATFSYYTGRPITLPEGSYSINNIPVNYYSGRNTYKLPDYHRLDLSVTIDSKKNENRKWKVSKTFSVFNAYANKNPFTIYTRTKQDKDGNIVGNGQEREARLVYLFSVLPSFSINVKF